MTVYYTKAYFYCIFFVTAPANGGASAVQPDGHSARVAGAGRGTLAARAAHAHAVRLAGGLARASPPGPRRR